MKRRETLRSKETPAMDNILDTCEVRFTLAYEPYLRGVGDGDSSKFVKTDGRYEYIGLYTKSGVIINMSRPCLDESPDNPHVAYYVSEKGPDRNERGKLTRKEMAVASNGEIYVTDRESMLLEQLPHEEREEIVHKIRSADITGASIGSSQKS